MKKSKCKSVHKGTVSLVCVFILLQIIQTIFPSFVKYQVCDPFLLINLRTIPLFLLTVITHMLSHGYWGHLWGNLAVGLPVMLYLEPKLGTKRFLKAYFLCGLGSMVLFTAMTGGAMVGSSGALFGLTAIACRVYGDNREQRLLAHLVLLLWLIPQFMALAAMDGIAHAGHVGGAITGLLLIYCHKK